MLSHPESPQGAPSGTCDVTACRLQHSLLTDTARVSAGTSGDLQPKIRTGSVGGKLLREGGGGFLGRKTQENSCWRQARDASDHLGDDGG